MGRRRKARESALQILFQLEFDDSPPEIIIEQYWKNKKTDVEEKETCIQIVNGVIQYRQEIDENIQAVSENWRISRMVLIDRNILRISTYEFLYGKDLAPGIIINEAIEIAKKFSSDLSATFINGILDALKNKLEKDKEQSKEKDKENE